MLRWPSFEVVGISVASVALASYSHLLACQSSPTMPPGILSGFTDRLALMPALLVSRSRMGGPLLPLIPTATPLRRFVAVIGGHRVFGICGICGLDSPPSTLRLVSVRLAATGFAHPRSSTGDELLMALQRSYQAFNASADSVCSPTWQPPVGHCDYQSVQLSVCKEGPPNDS